MSQKNHAVSNVDLGLPLEAQVLAQFFDNDFVPVDYINALISSTINQTTSRNAINNKSTELTSSASLKLAVERMNCLVLHFNEYTDELLKRFDQSYDKLMSSSTQIISYSTNDDNEAVTRLQYHLTNLNTSLYSLVEDIVQTNTNLEKLKLNEGEDKKSIVELQELMKIKNNIKKVQDSFKLLKSLVASTETNADKEVSEISISEFKDALGILTQLMQEQIQVEVKVVKETKETKINEKLIKIVDSMIELQPMFKSLIQFQPSYASFVDTLKVQKNGYMELFES